MPVLEPQRNMASRSVMRSPFGAFARSGAFGYTATRVTVQLVLQTIVHTACRIMHSRKPFRSRTLLLRHDASPSRQSLVLDDMFV